MRTANAVAVDPHGVRLLPLGLPDHHVGAAVRGVLPALGAVVGRRRRHPPHRGGPRIVVAGRRIPPPAGHRLGGDAVRLRRPARTSTRAYVPFAVAAGAAALWAKKYRDTTGDAAPQPDWYNSSSTTGWGFAGGSGGPSFDSFESALSSSIGAYTASQSSSSVGGSSGGGGSAAVAVAAAAEEEAAHGEIPADPGTGARWCWC